MSSVLRPHQHSIGYTGDSVFLSVCLSITRVDQLKWLKLGLYNFYHTVAHGSTGFQEILRGSS